MIEVQTKPNAAPSKCETSESQQLFSRTNCLNDELLYESSNLKLPLKFKVICITIFFFFNSYYFFFS